jgi:hypothetical protein
VPLLGNVSTPHTRDQTPASTNCRLSRARSRCLRAGKGKRPVGCRLPPWRQSREPSLLATVGLETLCCRLGDPIHRRHPRVAEPVLRERSDRWVAVVLASPLPRFRSSAAPPRRRAPWRPSARPPSRSASRRRASRRPEGGGLSHSSACTNFEAYRVSADSPERPLLRKVRTPEQKRAARAAGHRDLSGRGSAPGASRVGRDADRQEGVGHVFRFDGLDRCGRATAVAGNDPGVSRGPSATQQGDAIPTRPAASRGDHRGHAPGRT